MDPQNRANLWEHIMRLRSERGTTIVLTTHYLEEADAMAERVVVIDHGRIIADDTAGRAEGRPGRRPDHLHGRRRPTLARPRAVAGRIGSELQERAARAGRRRSRSGSSRPPALPAVLRRAGRPAVEVRAATLHQPTLDDVFLTLTGRSLREGADT